MPLRTLLCYGDSNTHGTLPHGYFDKMERFDWSERWTGVLARGLGTEWRVIEEGLPGRTTVHDDPIDGRHKNGLAHLRPCLQSQLPVDVLLLMLGTNDLKARFSATPADIASALQALLEEIRRCNAGPDGGQPKLIVMAPAPIEEVGLLGEIFVGGAVKSRQLAARYRQVAEAQGAAFVDAGEIIQVSPVDGVHFEADQHRRLGEHLVGVVRGLGVV
ncbi:SGNH/GDSL hydrolase family protein [Pseudomonas oryzihabitans]|uniref:SGNH/GDSL hydrolase family protein n=1 Tax=Pseudomonas oryzihabitans TaxID=47885 RepID=UPI0011A169FE|nr:SGNH/GDSL hydrolase family protein [Pseudomonas oryzihabitans]